MRVALVHDYLMQGMRGAERVLAIFHDLYPNAPIYTLLHNPEKMGQATADWDIRTSFAEDSWSQAIAPQAVCADAAGRRANESA